jgi:hypothetical protein
MAARCLRPAESTGGAGRHRSAARYLFIGSTAQGIYSVQEALPGTPVRHLSAVHLTQRLKRNEIQQDLAIAGHPDCS